MVFFYLRLNKITVSIINQWNITLRKYNQIKTENILVQYPSIQFYFKYHFLKKHLFFMTIRQRDFKQKYHKYILNK